MILRNEFTVRGDVDTVWLKMLDIQGVADCVPGAKIEEYEPPNVYRGAIRVRIGPMTVDYKGEATLAEVDEEARTATIFLKAREAKGQGSAVATVHNRLEAVPGGTRVVAETELQITGPQAQFGKGVLEDVGARIMSEFSQRLEERISSDSYGSSGGISKQNGEEKSRRTGSAVRNEDDALDLGRVMAQSMLDRFSKIGGAVVALGLVVILVRRACKGRRSF